MSRNMVGMADSIRSLTWGIGPSTMGLSAESDFMGNSTNHTASQTNSLPLLEDVPTTLLESFLPGFGVVRRFTLLTLGFDITIIVQVAFLLGIFYSSISYIWSRIEVFWNRNFTASISISSQEQVYQPTMRWLAAEVLKDDTQRLTITKIFNYYYAFYCHLDSDSESGLPPLYYTPSYGQTPFWWRGRRYVLTREGNNSGQSSYSSTETVHLYVSGCSSAPIKRLLEECQWFARGKQRFKTNIRCLDSYCTEWSQSFLRSSRPMDTVYLDPKTKTALLRDAERFIRPETYRFNASRGIPYRRGFLFHGPPGTGKTSLSPALAGKLCYDLYYLSINDKSLSDGKLRNLLNGLPSRAIILLEDIDAVGLARGIDKKSKPPGPPGQSGSENAFEVAEITVNDVKPSDDKVTLSGLLNAIDGVTSSEGRILIMTSNHPKALDKALIRPGRVDMQTYFGYASKTHVEEMYMRFFPNDPEEGNTTSFGDRELVEPLLEEKTRPPLKEPNKEMAERFASLLPQELLTPAEIQGYLLLHAQDPQKAFDGFAEWVETMKTAKAKGKNIIERE